MSWAHQKKPRIDTASIIRRTMCIRKSHLSASRLTIRNSLRNAKTLVMPKECGDPGMGSPRFELFWLSLADYASAMSITSRESATSLHADFQVSCLVRVSQRQESQGFPGGCLYRFSTVNTFGDAKRLFLRTFPAYPEIIEHSPQRTTTRRRISVVHRLADHRTVALSNSFYYRIWFRVFSD
jgi:hypothetical protein